MPVSFEPDLCCPTWLDRSFILCDAKTFGLPILYASEQFAALFQCAASECRNKKCGSLIGVERFLNSVAGIERCVQSCTLGALEVRKALKFLQDQASHEVKQMLAVGTGSFVTLNQTVSGNLIVVSAVLHLVEHPTLARQYAVGFQCDLTKIITIEALLSAASHSEVIAVEQTQSFLTECLDGLKKDGVMKYLHHVMQRMWMQEAVATSASDSELSKRRGLASLALKRQDSSGSALQHINYVQELAAVGYVMGSLIARGKHNRTCRVIKAKRGDETFAVKCVSERDLSQLLQDEHKVLQHLDHPSILKVFDLVIGNDFSAMVMEHIHGKRLSECMCKLSPRESYLILTKVLDVLVYLHCEHKIAHRDLKAENIMVDTRTEKMQAGELVMAKVIDFGSARKQVPDNCSSEECNSMLDEVASMASSFHENIDGQILPPPCISGRGNAFELDIYATGLIFVGLLARRETFTSDVFTQLNLNLRLPQISPVTKQYLCDMLNPNPKLRQKVEVAVSSLPEPDLWFTSGQSTPSEVAPQQVTSALESFAWSSLAVVGCSMLIAGALALTCRQIRAHK